MNKNINKNYSTISFSKKNENQIKRNITDLNNYFFDSYQNISNSFLKPECKSKEKKISNKKLTKDNITKFVNKFKTKKALIANKTNNNLIYSFSPLISQRVDNSLEKSIKNINYIKKELTWEHKQKPNRRIFSREYEIEKINKILDKNNSFKSNDNEIKNNILKNHNLRKYHNYSSSLTLNGFNKNNKNIFKEYNLGKRNIHNMKKFEYNRNYLKPFKKEKINKIFPQNEVEEFSNGLMFSPYF